MTCNCNLCVVCKTCGELVEWPHEHAFETGHREFEYRGEIREKTNVEANKSVRVRFEDYLAIISDGEVTISMPRKLYRMAVLGLMLPELERGGTVYSTYNVDGDKWYFSWTDDLLSIAHATPPSPRLRYILTLPGEMWMMITGKL